MGCLETVYEIKKIWEGSNVEKKDDEGIISNCSNG